MGLKNLISVFTKDYIVFPDLLYGLSSANNEPLYDVIEYLSCTGFDMLNTFSLGPRCEMSPNHDSSKTIYSFLNSVKAAIPQDKLEWVLTDSDSLDALTAEAEQELVSLFRSGSFIHFNVPELLEFAPLDGLLHFVDVEHTVKDESVENPIDRLVEEEHKKYVAVNKFVNDLSKSESFGAGHPLKITVKYILENYINDFHLYRFKNKVYSLVSETNNCKYKSASEILRSVYDTLDDHQTGTVKADREPFKDFYFAYSEVGHLIGSDPETVEKENSIHVEKQSSINSVKLLNKSYVINSLGENQRLLITYPLFTEEEIACLIIDENPTCISHDDNYLRHSRMISKAISGGLLTPNDEGQIPVKQVKTWLASHNFVYKGFNDGTPTYADQLAEMREEAIEANVKILNLTAKLEDAELDSIIHSQPAHKFLLKDAQATIDQLSKENAELHANKNIESSQLKKDDEVGEQTVEKLKKMSSDYEELKINHESINAQNKELLEKVAHYKLRNKEELTQYWEDESKKYKSKIEELEAVIKEFSDVKTFSQAGDGQLYNWETMDKNQYPPELHLAIEIWKEYYRADDIGDIAQFNTARFNRIATRMNLNKGNLKKRIRSILTPLKSKKTATDLLTTLRGIDIIYNDKMED